MTVVVGAAHPLLTMSNALRTPHLRYAEKEGYEGIHPLLIAASALRHNVTFLTNNRRDFERIEGLTIESV